MLEGLDHWHLGSVVKFIHSISTQLTLMLLEDARSVPCKFKDHDQAMCTNKQQEAVDVSLPTLFKACYNVFGLSGQTVPC